MRIEKFQNSRDNNFVNPHWRFIVHNCVHNHVAGRLCFSRLYIARLLKIIPRCLHIVWQSWTILSVFLRFMIFLGINVKSEIHSCLMLQFYFYRFGSRIVGQSGVSERETKWMLLQLPPTSRMDLERNSFSHSQTPTLFIHHIHITIIGRRKCHHR